MLTKNACLVFEDGEIMKGYGYGATRLLNCALIRLCSDIKKLLVIHLTLIK